MLNDKKLFESIWEEIMPKELHFLQGKRNVRGERIGLRHAYMMVVTLATSQKDVERVHNLLPDNCQLFQEHMSLLRDVRSRLYNGNPPNDGRRPSDPLCEMLLLHACEGNDLTRWYMDVLLEGRKHCEISGISNHVTVYSHRDRSGHGGRHFYSTLFGLDVEVGVCFSTDFKTLGVYIVTCQTPLNRPFVEKARRCEALAATQHNAFCCHGSRGYEHDYWFLFDAESYGEIFRDLVEEQLVNDDYPYAPKIWVARDGFTEQVWQALSDAGLGTNLAPLQPVLPASGDGE